MTRTVSFAPAVRSLLDTASRMAGGRAGYVVGGSLRDALLGRPVGELDLAVAGDALEYTRALSGALGGHYVLLDEERGTARVALEDGPVRAIDVAALRGGIEADLGLRDFTVDALALDLYALDAGEAIDPHGGLRDLEARTIRLVSEQALVDDALRLLRAVRLAVQLEFSIEPETAEALRTHAHLIGRAAAERQRDELARAFATPRAAQALRLLDGAGLLEQVFPEVTAGRGVTQPKEHHWDVFDHAIETVAALDFMLAEEEPEARRERALWRELWTTLGVFPGLREHLREETGEGRSRAVLLKFAGLLHDVAKPETRAPDATGRVRFFGHAEIGAETARRVLRRLRFGRRETELVGIMIEDHLRPTQLGHQGPPSKRALFRFFRDTGEAAESLLLLSLADHLAARGPRLRIDGWRQHVAYIAYMLARRNEEREIARRPRPVTGDDIMQDLSLAPGPEVGRLLAAIEEALATGEIATREEALELARRIHRGENAAPREVPRKALAGAGMGR